MSMWRVARRTALSLQPITRRIGEFPSVRAFSNPTRITDVSRQRTVVPGANKPLKKSTDVLGSGDQFVAEFTREQKLAADAKRQADEELVMAKQALTEATGIAKALKKVAEDAVATLRAAEAIVVSKQKAADEAMIAKKKADDGALEGLKQAETKTKRFLEKAFDHFDSANQGYLAPEQFPAILKSLKLPAEAGEVDELVSALDVAQNDVVSRKEWSEYMPQEVKNALRDHPLAQQWAA